MVQPPPAITIPPPITLKTKTKKTTPPPIITTSLSSLNANSNDGVPPPPPFPPPAANNKTTRISSPIPPPPKMPPPSQSQVPRESAMDSMIYSPHNAGQSQPERDSIPPPPSLQPRVLARVEEGTRDSLSYVPPPPPPRQAVPFVPPPPPLRPPPPTSTSNSNDDEPDSPIPPPPPPKKQTTFAAAPEPQPQPQAYEHQGRERLNELNELLFQSALKAEAAKKAVLAANAALSAAADLPETPKTEGKKKRMSMLDNLLFPLRLMTPSAKSNAEKHPSNLIREKSFEDPSSAIPVTLSKAKSSDRVKAKYRPMPVQPVKKVKALPPIDLTRKISLIGPVCGKSKFLESLLTTIAYDNAINKNATLNSVVSRDGDNGNIKTMEVLVKLDKRIETRRRWKALKVGMKFFKKEEDGKITKKKDKSEEGAGAGTDLGDDDSGPDDYNYQEGDGQVDETGELVYDESQRTSSAADPPLPYMNLPVEYHEVSVLTKIDLTITNENDVVNHNPNQFDTSNPNSHISVNANDELNTTSNTANDSNYNKVTTIPPHQTFNIALHIWDLSGADWNTSSSYSSNMSCIIICYKTDFEFGVSSTGGANSSFTDLKDRWLPMGVRNNPKAEVIVIGIKVNKDTSVCINTLRHARETCDKLNASHFNVDLSNADVDVNELSSLKKLKLHLYQSCIKRYLTHTMENNLALISTNLNYPIKPLKRSDGLWIPDETSLFCQAALPSVQCAVKRLKFGYLMGQRRHHCRCCGTVICTNCSVFNKGVANGDNEDGSDADSEEAYNKEATKSEAEDKSSARVVGGMFVGGGKMRVCNSCIRGWVEWRFGRGTLAF